MLLNHVLPYYKITIIECRSSAMLNLNVFQHKLMWPQLCYPQFALSKKKNLSPLLHSHGNED